jgi:periplasmic protein TonB
MFDVLLETRRRGVHSGAVWPFPVAASMHFLVVGGFIAASLLALQRVPETDNPFRNGEVPVFLGPGSLPPPLGEGGTGAGAPVTLPRPRPIPTREIVQPRNVTTEMPAPDRPDDAVEEAVPGALRTGVGSSGAGGTGTGWPWGVPGGPGDGLGTGGWGSGERVEPAAPAGPVEITPEMTPPVLVSKVQPRYPETARRARLPGVVLLEAVIDEEGNVEDVTVLRTSSPVFNDAAVGAVRGWKYRAALQNGRPVRVYFRVRVEFELR